MFNLNGFDNHESLHVFSDPHTGLRAAVAIHSTARGPAAGGCRVWDYQNAREMLSDVLALSRAMSLKSAMADLPLGGGKTVVWLDRDAAKTPQMLTALGERIDLLNGRYWAACDIGMMPADLQHIRVATRYVSGLTDGPHASGDSAPATVDGVYLSMRRAARRVLGSDRLKGVRIAIQGVGKVGAGLARKLAGDGARVTLCDVNRNRAEGLASGLGASAVAPEDIYDVACEIFSPNGVGGTISEETAQRLKASIIVGGANNQLASAAAGEYLHRSGIVYGPDYVVNGGGIINLAGEILGRYDAGWVEEKVMGLADTLDAVLAGSQQQGLPPERVADTMARQRIAAAEGMSGV